MVNVATSSRGRSKYRKKNKKMDSSVSSTEAALPSATCVSHEPLEVTATADHEVTKVESYHLSNVDDI